MNAPAFDRPPHQQRRRSPFNWLRRAWIALWKRSAPAAITVWLASVGSGVFGFIYGAITGPARLHALEVKQEEWARERALLLRLAIWQANHECGRIPSPIPRFSTDAEICGEVSALTKALYPPPPSVPDPTSLPERLP